MGILKIVFTLEVQCTVAAVKMKYTYRKHRLIDGENVCVPSICLLSISSVDWVVTCPVPKLKSNWAVSAFSLSLNFIPVLQVGSFRICKKVSVSADITVEKLLTLSPPHILDESIAEKRED